jgi:hypothetical protein
LERACDYVTLRIFAAQARTVGHAAPCVMDGKSVTQQKISRIFWRSPDDVAVDDQPAAGVAVVRVVLGPTRALPASTAEQAKSSRVLISKSLAI